MSLTREDLDKGQCAGCDSHGPAAHQPLYLHGRCHPGAGTRCRYDDGTLAVICAKKGCGKLIAEIAVASGVRP